MLGISEEKADGKTKAILKYVFAYKCL